MIRKILFLTALIAIPALTSSNAKAEEYCREYTKNVSINGRVESAYGTACYRPDGSWEIVNLEGSDRARADVRETMYNDIERQVNYRDRDRVIIVENYNRSPRYYRPYHRYQSVAYTSPFVFYFGNYKGYNNLNGYKNKSYNKSYKNVNYRDRDYNRGRDRGRNNR